MVLAGLLAVFVFVLGPTTHSFDTITETAGDYLAGLPAMSFASGGGEWLASWTLFSWAWWISWTPFVGAFIARISRGRTIRQFVTFVMVIPTLVSLVWSSVLGGSATHLQLTGQADLSGALTDTGTEGALSSLLGEFPLATLTSTLVMILIALFFISSADSASRVLGMLSQRGTISPSRWIVALWGVSIARRRCSAHRGRRPPGDAVRDHPGRHAVPARARRHRGQPRDRVAQGAVRLDPRPAGPSCGARALPRSRLDERAGPGPAAARRHPSTSAAGTALATTSASTAVRPRGVRHHADAPRRLQPQDISISGAGRGGT